MKTRALAWLRNAEGSALELDFWNEELRLGLEYQGQQHYHIVSHWHRNGEADLQKQKDHDAIKVEACIVNMASLIVVPYHAVGAARSPQDKLRALAEFIWAAVADCGYSAGTHLATKEELLAALEL